MQSSFVEASLARRPTRALRAIIALVLTLAVAGCATFDLDTPKNAAVPPPTPPPTVPTGAPPVTGVEKPQSNEHRQLVEMMGGEYRSPAAVRHLNDVLAKLAAASELPGEAYRVTILNTPAVNAFALPSGNLYITRGLLALANDTSEVAGVMAHEIAHVTARHAAQRAEQEKNQELLKRVNSVIPPARGQRADNGRQTLASFSRAQELEADRVGVLTIGRSGYDPYGASRFLAQLGRSTALRASLLGQRASDNDLLSSHPTTPERIARAVTTARQIGAPGIGDAGRDAYLAVIDGMEFGDDPTEGAIRGRRFAHVRLGFEFTAPDGFALENTAQAVLGIAAGGAEALRLDNVRVKTTTPLETYLASGWVEGLQKASIRPATVHGMPAAFATAKAGDWSFRVAVIRMGGEVFRLIFAARTLSEEIDQRFQASIESFRRLPQDEAAKLRPNRLGLLTSGSSDTLESLAARMAFIDRPREHFLLLNGLENAAAVKPGERYKIVVE